MKENAIHFGNYRKIVKKTTVFLMTLVLVFSLFSFQNSVVTAASLKAPTIKSVTAKSSTSITIKWKKVSGISGYIIYQKKGSGNYKKLTVIKDSSDVSYTAKDLSTATKYSYKVKTYTVKNGKKTYSSKSTAKSAYTKPSVPKNISATAKSASSIKVSWKKVTRADGYAIYQKSGDAYKKIATVKSGSTTSYTVKDLKSDTKYTYLVKAYCKTSDSKLYSSKSKVATATTKTAAQKVYSTPTGKRYHYDAQCGGKNSSETTLELAKSLGLMPCKKCAQ